MALPHVFDTGLEKPLRALVRDGLVAALAPLLVANGGYLAAIKPFAGTIAGRKDEDGIDRAYKVLNGQAPSVLVACGDKSYEAAGSTGYFWQAGLTVQVIFLSNHTRSLEARLAGDLVSATVEGSDPGIEVALEHVEELLIGRNFSIGEKAHVMVPVSEEELATDQGLTLWVQTYRIAVSRDVLEHRVVLQRITEFMTTWRGKPAPASPTEHTFQALTDQSP